MLIKFICCDVFARIACDLVARSPHIVDVEFLPMMAHVEPDKLRQTISERILDSVDGSARNYDALILGFGLCGNATIGLTCPIPMVIPRAHDCCTVFMGSKSRFLEAFGDSLSARWCSTGYWERAFTRNSGYPAFDQPNNYKTSEQYMAFLEEYDEETAEYLWQTMHPSIEMKTAFYIRQDGFEYSAAQDGFKSLMDRDGVELQTVDGSTSLLEALVFGEWDNERFLVVPPGKRIVGVYDMDSVVKAED